MERYRLIFSGSGGQGVITASIILAEAAVLHEGLNAVQSQSYGPEARGGATRADVIISDRDIRYPKVIQPNVLICLTQEAYNKFSCIIRPGGLLLTDNHFVKQEKKVDARQKGLNLYKAAMEKTGNPLVFNICLLGAVTGITGIVKAESIIKVLQTRIQSDFFRINKEAFEIGLELANNLEKEVEPNSRQESG